MLLYFLYINFAFRFVLLLTGSSKNVKNINMINNKSAINKPKYYYKAFAEYIKLTYSVTVLHF